MTICAYIGGRGGLTLCCRSPNQSINKSGGAENDGDENDGPSKCPGMKLTDMKMTDMKMQDMFQVSE